MLPTYHPLTRCDEPWVCAAGTDCSDCSVAAGTNCSLAAGTDRRCRFGVRPLAATVAAEAVAATGFGLALVCVSPAAPSAGGSAGAEPLEVTLNGQQYSTFGHAFDYFAPPIAALVAPTGGPTQGGTVIIVSGSDFDGSDQRHSDRRCVLGAALMPADLVNGTLRCTTPPLPASSRPTTVRLNGQEESTVAPAAAFGPISTAALPFALWPPPRLTGLSPACGPVEGGTSVLLSGSQMRDTSQPFDELRCRFGAASVPGAFL